ncbi:MAG: RagB/SusD family nutrient uptake outer membrane protein [Daejeonella sp.]
MKKINYKLFIPACLLLLITAHACKDDFLNVSPAGASSEAVLATRAGVDGLLIGTYALLDGIGGPGGDVWAQSVTNWIWGGVASDDAHKGSEYGDQPQAEQVENYTTIPSMGYIINKWAPLYAGAQRANDVLRVLRKVPSGTISAADTLQIASEARFLRAVFHFEAVKMFGEKVPYVGEDISYENGNLLVPNDASIYPQIQADLQFAATNLANVKPNFGRVNSWAAKSLLAEVLMFQDKYAEALPILKDVVANGVNSSGVKYALVPRFSDNFRASMQNNSETVFAIQMSVGDGAGGLNGNAGDVLNFPGGGPASCCGFYQPSFSLANAFKVDAAGLPLFENAAYNNTNLTTDQGLTGAQAYTPGNEALDPRIDWTIGRRGIPYLDWGIMPGQTWVRAQAAAGPYLPAKNIYWKAEQGSQSDFYDGWAANQSTGNNYNYIRFADVLLLAAEAEAEAGSLAEAERLVNLVRSRAANTEGWVHTYVDGDPDKGFTDVPAANYRIGLYTGQFATRGQAYAREAVRFERRLELAMEGKRFFDLQRWDNGTGYMAGILNAYIAKELQFFPTYQILKGAKFTQGQDEVFPIPQGQIDISQGTLKQNQNTGG